MYRVKSGKARGGGASAGPTAPWPSGPWQVAHMCVANASLPFCAFPTEEFCARGAGFCAGLPWACVTGYAASATRSNKRDSVRSKRDSSANRFHIRSERQIRRKRFIGLSGLRHDVYHGGLAAVDYLERSLQRGTQIFGIRDRPFAIHAHALRQLGIFDIRRGDGGADSGAIDAAIVAIGHDLHLHYFLMIAAIVVHHAEQRNLMMRGSPEHSGRVHQIAVALDVDREAAVFAIGERRADSCGRAVADAVAALRSRIVIMLIHIPQPLRPIADKHGGGNERPVAIFNLVPYFGAQSR